MTEREDFDLDALLDTARGQDLPVRADFMARVLADAAALQRPAAALSGRSRGSWISDLFGGWPALGGVLVAGAAGLWVGIAPPAGVEQLAAQMLGATDSVTFLPSDDLTLFEEPTDG